MVDAVFPKLSRYATPANKLVGDAYLGGVYVVLSVA